MVEYDGPDMTFLYILSRGTEVGFLSDPPRPTWISLSFWAGESQAGNPIGSALVCIKVSHLVHCSRVSQVKHERGGNIIYGAHIHVIGTSLLAGMTCSLYILVDLVIPC